MLLHPNTIGTLVFIEGDTNEARIENHGQNVLWLRERGGTTGKTQNTRAPKLAARSAFAGAITGSLFLDEAEGVALLDPEGRVVRVNTCLSVLTGVLVGHIFWEVVPESSSILQEPLEVGLAARGSVTVVLDEVRRTLQMSLLPIPSKGALLRVLDRTREQELEEKLVQAHRLQEVGVLAGEVGHDINNLLTAIQCATDDLRRRAINRPSDLADLEIVHYGTQRTSALLQHLLSFGRHENPGLHALDLNDFVRDAVAILRRLLGPSVTLMVYLGHRKQKICVNPTQFDRILINLTVNASHAMPQGGKLTITTCHELFNSPQKFGKSVVPVGDYARIMVQDTGVGISEEALPRIFERLFTTREQSGGTGQGLSNVHSIIASSGGYINVQSIVGQGTLFDILLPCINSEPLDLLPNVPLLDKAPSRLAGSPKILVVDDDPFVRAYLLRILRNSGWRSVMASSAEEALDLSLDVRLCENLSGVISDMTMPGLTGRALILKLRDWFPNLPAILMSGHQDVCLQSSLQADEISFLSKPFSAGDVETLVQSMFDRGSCGQLPSWLSRQSNHVRPCGQIAESRT